MVKIERVVRGQMLQSLPAMPESDRQVFDRCLMLSSMLWVGKVDSILVCAWGLIAPTILSERAYLWLYTTEALVGHEFLFVRHSQRMVEEMLKQFPIIVGHTKANSPGIRWLRWLGATFDGPVNGLIPFAIRKKNG